MTDNLVSLAQSLENDLFSRFGPMLGGEDLRLVLGYPSMESMRQALSRQQLPVAVFVLPRRRGKFALAKDVALWLAKCRASAVLPTQGAIRDEAPPKK